jgi:peptidoglycan/xylan/chitin deacetylase (PgdA/CDA1 family)
VSSGACTLTVSDYVAATAQGDLLPHDILLITFDDGFEDFATTALPDLEERGLRSTLYVATGLLRGKAGMRRTTCSDRMLDWSQLAELVSRGVEIGGHSHTHPHLDTLSRRRAVTEIDGSRRLLEDELQVRISSFAYPHGYFSPLVRSLVRDAGYESACAVRNALSVVGEDRFALSRLMVRAETSPHEVSAWAAGIGPQAPTRERIRTRGWRAARRARAVVGRRPVYEFR